jgi:hypothetical protein
MVNPLLLLPRGPSCLAFSIIQCPGSAADPESTKSCPMQPRSTRLQINVLLPAADYRIYVSAARKLRRIMGQQAPDALNLVGFSLQGRDANGIADDYLDSVRWPHAAGRMVSLRRPAKPARRIPRLPARTSCAETESDRTLGRVGPPANLSRN